MTYIKLFVQEEIMDKQQAIKFFGTQRAIAKALNDNGSPITESGVCRWPDNAIPMRRQYELAQLSNGKLKADRQK